MSAWSPARAAADPSAPAAVQRPAAPAPLLGPSPWQYINVVLAQTEVFLPVFDVAAAQGLASQLWDWEAAGSEKSEFHRVADLALAQMVLDLLDRQQGGSGEWPGVWRGLHAYSPGALELMACEGLSRISASKSLPPGAGNALSLEERGLVVSSTALRVSYAYGGDGETDFRVDLRELAGFVRDPDARVNCFLLPLSCTIALRRVVPQAAEAEEVERLHAAAAMIQRAWRLFRIVQKLRAAGKSDSVIRAAQRLIPSSGLGSPVATKKNLESLMEKIEGGPRMGTIADMQSECPCLCSFSPSFLPSWKFELSPLLPWLAHTLCGCCAVPAGRPWQVVDDLVMDVASPHTQHLLAEYKRQSAEKSQLIYLQQFRATSTTVLRVDAGALTARAAFSHIPFWQDLVDAVQRMVMPSPVEPVAAAGAAPADVTPAPGSADGPSLALSEVRLCIALPFLITSDTR